MDPFVTTKLAFLFTIVLIEDLPFLDRTTDQSKAVIPRQLSFAHLTPLAGFAARMFVDVATKCRLATVESMRIDCSKFTEAQNFPLTWSPRHFAKQYY